MNEPIWSVSDVNGALRDLIENSMMPFWLHGEVGSLTIHSSGHVYLTLKDQNSVIRATFFKGAAIARIMNLKVGMQVEAFGKLGVYPARGEYQFSIRSMRDVGLGKLQMQFEQIKNKLNAEGLFDPARKRALPLLPQTIGLITSPTGAAIRDFLQILSRRAPNIHVRIFPALVQGQGTVESVIRGIEFFNRTRSADVLVITRGGGSMEDLWPFNDERLARALSSSQIPTVSAIGHEIDFSICDFVADLRVPTPSAAAELVAAGNEELKLRIDNDFKALKTVLAQKLNHSRYRLDLIEQSYIFKAPEQAVQIRMQYIDDLQNTLLQKLNAARSTGSQRLELFNHLLQQKSQLAVVDFRNNLLQLDSTLNHSVQNAISNRKAVLDNLCGKLQSLNPCHVLSRGYAMLKSKDGKHIVSSIHGLTVGDELNAQLSDGKLCLEIKDIIKDNTNLG